MQASLTLSHSLLLSIRITIDPFHLERITSTITSSPAISATAVFARSVPRPEVSRILSHNRRRSNRNSANRRRSIDLPTRKPSDVTPRVCVVSWSAVASCHRSHSGTRHGLSPCAVRGGHEGWCVAPGIVEPVLGHGLKLFLGFEFCFWLSRCCVLLRRVVLEVRRCLDS